MSSPLPKWLIGKDDRFVRNDVKELIVMQYEIILDTVLDKLSCGETLGNILKDDVREFDRARFLRWILKDPIRKEKYYEALELGCEIIASKLPGIAEGSDSFEDVQRSTLKINTLKYLLGVWNKKRFGEIKQIEHSGAISITKALEEAATRLVVDAEYREVED